MVSRPTPPRSVHAFEQASSGEAAGQGSRPCWLNAQRAYWSETRWQLAVRRRMFWSMLGGLLLAAAFPWPLEAQAPATKKSRIEGAAKVRMLSALAALVLLGLGMMALVWLGARITQRYRHSTPYFRPTPRPGEHDWARKPLVPPPELPDRRRDGRTGPGPIESG